MSVAYYAFFIVLGTVVSFEDWTQRKVRNQLILLGLAVSGAYLCGMFVDSALGYRSLRFLGSGEFYFPWHYYPAVLLHLTLCVVASFTLWRLSVWPAGDAKFYILCGFCAVLVDQNLPGFPRVLFLLMLINIFVPAGAAFAAEAVIRAVLRAPELRAVDWSTWRKAALDRARRRLRDAWPHRLAYLVLGVNLFAFFFLMQAVHSKLSGAGPDPWMGLLVFLIMAVLWRGVSTLLKNKRVGAVAFAGVCVWSAVSVIYGDWEVAGLLRAALKMTLSFGMFLSLARMLFYWMLERESLRELDAEQLVPGLLLSDETWERLCGDEQLTGKLGGRYADGLSAKDAELLKAWIVGRQASEYTVYHTIPFAVWIFLGTLLTMSSRISVVSRIASGYKWAEGALRLAAGL